MKYEGPIWGKNDLGSANEIAGQSGELVILSLVIRLLCTNIGTNMLGLVLFSCFYPSAIPGRRVLIRVLIPWCHLSVCPSGCLSTIQCHCCN